MTMALWHNRKIVVCVGTGGVGKTTVAAALALAAAASGRRVAVMTIDPSKRLSQALGIDANSPELQPVPLGPIVQQLGGSAHEGSLHAIMLDVQHTFDQLIQARARTPEAAQAILNNRIYKHFSASLAGSHEYAAVEKLYDIHEDERFDLVVLDTPPSHHALDFLDAPGRILRFLQGQDTDAASETGPSLTRRLGRKLFDLGGSVVTRTVGKVSGAQTLQEVTAFLMSLKDMYASFHTRAAAVEALLQSDDVAFTLVGGPSQAQGAALEHFAQELHRFHIKPAAWVLNRVRPAFMPPHDAGYRAQALARLKDQHPSLVAECAEVAQAIEEELRVTQRDAAQLAQLRQDHGDSTIVSIPDEPGGADSLERLARLCRALQGA